MTKLPDIQIFFANILKQIDTALYPKTQKIIIAFNELPSDFMELTNDEIKQKNIKEKKQYLIPSAINNYDNVPSVEDRRHYVFEQIFTIYETLGNEMPALVKLLFKFTESINLKDHAEIIAAKKTIWRFLLAENIKYDIQHIETTLSHEAESLNQVAQNEIIDLSKIFINLQNQLKGLKVLSNEDFSTQDLLEICKSIKALQSGLLYLIKNGSIKSYQTILKLENWNDELNNHRTFIAENLYLARKAHWAELDFWNQIDRGIYIGVFAVGIINLATVFIALIIDNTEVATTASVIVLIMLLANIIRGIIKWIARKINYDLPITLKQTHGAMLKAIAAPLVIASTFICHPIEMTMQVVKFAKDLRNILEFCHKNIKPTMENFANTITAKAKNTIINLTGLLKQKLPWVNDTIKLIKPTKLQTSLIPKNTISTKLNPEFFYHNKQEQETPDEKIDFSPKA